jgi:hypothetical protein
LIVDSRSSQATMQLSITWRTRIRWWKSSSACRHPPRASLRTRPVRGRQHRTLARGRSVLGAPLVQDLRGERAVHLL